MTTEFETGSARYRDKHGCCFLLSFFVDSISYYWVGVSPWFAYNETWTAKGDFFLGKIKRALQCVFKFDYSILLFSSRRREKGTPYPAARKQKKQTNKQRTPDCGLLGVRVRGCDVECNRLRRTHIPSSKTSCDWDTREIFYVSFQEYFDKLCARGRHLISEAKINQAVLMLDTRFALSCYYNGPQYISIPIFFRSRWILGLGDALSLMAGWWLWVKINRRHILR